MSRAHQDVKQPVAAVVPKSVFDLAVQYAAQLETQVDNAQTLMCKMVALHKAGDLAALGTILEQVGARAAALAQQQRQPGVVH